MAVTVTSAFIGTAIGEILEALVLGTESISKGLINVIPSKMDNIYLPRMAHDVNPIQARIPEPTTETDWTYDERVITPADMMAYGRFLPQQFENVWEQFWSQGALVDQELNMEVLRAVLSTLQKQFNNQMDRLIWQGDTTLTGNPLVFMDGYLKLLLADAGTIDVPNAGVIDESNVIDILNSVLSAVPDPVFDQSGAVKIVTNHKTARFYDSALRALDFKGVDPTQGNIRAFGGVPLVAVHGIGDNNIVAGALSAGTDSNFHAGTWMESDRENIKVARFRPESEYWFAKILFKFGVQVGYPSETVLYKGSTL